MPHYKRQDIRPVYISKHKNKGSTHVILLMITDGDNNWHYLAVTRIFGLLRGKTSNHYGDFYCLNCFRPYSIKNSLKEYEKICYDHKYCFPKMSDAENNILKSKPGKKSLKQAFVNVYY